MGFGAMLWVNSRRRMTDGFATGYNMVFPILMIWLLGFLCKNMFSGEITGYQYYAVVLPPYCILMAVITAAYAGKDDAYAKTAERVLAAPVSKWVIVITKVIAETLVFTACTYLVLAGSVIIWKLPIGDSLLYLCLLYFSVSLLTAAVGTYIGLGMKNFLAVKNLINLPLGIFAIAGGCFFRIGTLSPTGQLLLNLSPLTWINRSIFLTLYDANHTPVLGCSLCLGLIGAGFTVLAAMTFKKEEYCNGELPSYEK